MHYRARLTWTGNRGQGTATYEGYGRDFTVGVEGKPDLAGSSDPAFRGDPARHNPEDLLVAALAGCHMLAYLALCARAGVRVMDYRDDATGAMTLDGRGGGRFVEVVLRPLVVIADGRDAERAASLHEAAHQRCFIASSCNFPVRHAATIEVAAP